MEVKAQLDAKPFTVLVPEDDWAQTIVSKEKKTSFLLGIQSSESTSWTSQKPLNLSKVWFAHLIEEITS